MFNMFDDDKGGTIDVEEFMIMIDSLGMEMSEEQVREMMFKVRHSNCSVCVVGVWCSVCGETLFGSTLALVAYSIHHGSLALSVLVVLKAPSHSIYCVWLHHAQLIAYGCVWLQGYPGAEELDFAMFVELVASARTTTGGGGVLNRISELQESFTMFDEDGSGALDAEEIQVHNSDC